MKKGKVLRLPTLNIALASADPLIPDIHIAKISIQSPEVVIKKNKEGAINLLNLLAQDKKTKPGRKEGPPSGSEKNSNLKARVDEVTVEAADLTFVDETTDEPANIRISPLNLKMVNLSNEKGLRGAMSNCRSPWPKAGKSRSTAP